MEELKDRAAMFLEAEFNISGDQMVDMNHDLDNIPLIQRGSFNMFDIMAAFVESERGQADTGEGQLTIPVVTHRALQMKLEKLEAENKLLAFMVENGLGEDDMKNDITLPHEI